MSEELIKVFDYLADKFGIVIDWTSENVTPYLLDLFQRIKTYNIVVNIFWICVGIILFIISIFLIKTLIKWDKSDEYADDWVAGGVLAFLLVFMILAPVFFFSGISDLIESIYIPEKIVLEMISDINLK